MDGVSIRILDVDHPRIDRPLPPDTEGQVAIAAPSMLSGYVDEPAPLLGGHFLTGDLGMLDEQGHLAITGRLKLLIDVGGRKVNPSEVEAVLRCHPDVGECVVVPMRLSQTVCRLRAIVTPARPDIELSPQELRRFARQRLSACKVPRIFDIRPNLPTGPSGKVLRHLVEAS
jgi:acyl-CoA synthetase (AMP-forming)/AMP-acid ligase II